ncbi:MAG TPA: TetR/AcrR family transcriptional regulator [Methylophaga sp.]|uniref:TetR/AcrR family transcriptional regulator n=1 Tax=unclassified Methylophaga TaxID=2629249 RepID=UPI000C8B0BB4|nr:MULTISPECIES: TetR/AcrR family transcriptional regulator [unclassified Methylophaga]MAP25532.1 TetR family transcriptional regulator [Methylophaga sp.]HAD32070.1 TetR/AcrR family transcriptional regulator [Methylophaga sp.]HCO01328.1 TetR/AcrR family transcriptional regulator [Methylophaga sp.]
MATRANSSRERILSTAESLILQKGFAGTTIDEILEKSAITKGGFFYHFNGKMDLARAIVERYISMDNEVFDELSAQADKLSEDPLQQTLIFLNLFTDMVGGLTSVHPGCVVAVFTYEAQMLDQDIQDAMREGMLGWREMMAKRIEKIQEKYRPRLETSTEALADMFSSLLEGGIILARLYGDNQALISQVQAYRSHLRLLFEPA